MRQKEVSKWLKLISIVIGFMGAVFFFLLLPIMANEMRVQYEEVAFLFWPGLIYGWTIGLCCYAILFQFWKVCNEIGKDNSFSKENADSFVKISRIAVIMAFLWFAGLVVLTVKSWINPPFIIIIVFALLLSIIIAILAAALSHLIIKAYEMKEENDLTI